MSLRLGVESNRCRKATRFALVAGACAALWCAPVALALEPVSDAAVTDVATTDAALIAAVATAAAPATETVQTAETTLVTDTPAPPEAPVDQVAQPAPEAPAATTPPPDAPIAPSEPTSAPAEPIAASAEAPAAPAAATSESPPPPPSAPSELTLRTPPAPHEPFVAKRDDEAIVGTAASQSVFAEAEPVVAAQNEATRRNAASPPPPSLPRVKGSPLDVIGTPIVAPIVQRLLPVVTAPFAVRVSQSAAGSVTAASPATADGGGAAVAAEASHVQSDLLFSGFVPSGGWSDQSAGLLAVLMGLLPLGLPDGKFSMNAETQVGLLLLGALLIIVPFFANPIRDRRRRGPRGFATLALRPG